MTPDDLLRRAEAAKARVPQVEAGAVDALRASGVLLIDAREPEAHAQASVPGACNLAYETLAEHIAAAAPDRSAPIVCCCNGGKRGPLAAALLLDLGYRDVKVIAGGLRAYLALPQG